MANAVPPSEHGENSAAVRIALRRGKIAAREALPAEIHRQFSQRIEARLEELLSQHAPSVIGFCWPIRAEFDARPLVGRLLERRWSACMPVVAVPAQPLLFREWMPDCAMSIDLHGIPHPSAGRNLHPHVLLLPVNACDRAGYRLGYGGGYFDRTLAVAVPRPLSIGVGFELCRVASVRPQAHDIPVDMLVTEDNCYKFHHNRHSSPIE